MNSYKFYECPAALLQTDRGLVSLVSLVNWSEEMHTPLLDGGLLNHTNWYFEARNVIVNEQKMIENEEMKKARSESKSKGRGSGSSKVGKRPISHPRASKR